MDNNYNKQERLLDKTENDSLFQEPLKPSKPWYKRWWLYAYLVVVAVSLLVLVVFSQATNQVLDKLDLENTGVGNIADITTTVAGQTFLPGGNSDEIADFSPLELVLKNAQDDQSFGNPEAKVVIVEFADFQCPFCKESAVILKQVLSRYSDDIYFIYRDFPITELHPQALTAALAGQCAWEQNLFWPLHDLLFARQDDLNNQVIMNLAAQAGLDLDKFSLCMDNKKYLEEVLTDLGDGIDLGVAGTPTFFINGYSISGTVPLDKWEELIKLVKFTVDEQF